MAFQLHRMPNDSCRRSFDRKACPNHIRVFFVFIRQGTSLGPTMQRGAVDPGGEMAPVASGHRTVCLMRAWCGDGRAEADEFLPCSENSRKPLRGARLYNGN